MNEPLLQIDHLTKAYGETAILKDVSFSVGQGEVVVIIGPSGCGKSTLLRCHQRPGAHPGRPGPVKRPGHRPGSQGPARPAPPHRYGVPEL